MTPGIRRSIVFLIAGLASCRHADGAAAQAGGGGASERSVVRSVASRSGPDDSLSLRADRARVQGDSAAPLWVVMVSDFQCPYCKTWHHESYGALVKEYVATGKVRMAYLNYPLPMHSNALPAAEAAMCAGAQGKFWPMHDAIFSARERWSELPSPDAAFDSLATGAAVEMVAWRKCVSTHALRPLIQADYERSSAAGIHSTPTFLIGDTRIAGAQPLAQFRAAIDAALAKAGRPSPR